MQENENKINSSNNYEPETLTNTAYTPAFLKRYIGRLVRIEFLIGSNYLEDRTGLLLEVGASYVLLRAVQDRNLLYCDIYSIKFVTISETNSPYNSGFQTMWSNY